LNLIQMLGLLVGGLALFLFGLELMTAGLKTMAGAKLQKILSRMTANRFLGVAAGGVVTAILNSSTITTVLMVGFVSTGLMTLAQSVPMIMGANIGSTVTAQIMAFNVSALAPFMLAAGFLCHAFADRAWLRQLGGIVLGFGLLFLGIQFMSEATQPLRAYQPFIDAMQGMRNPLLGILIGAAFTAIVQSSAATLAIIIALAAQGLMPLQAAIALILGANIGTCGTALLAAIGRPPEALQVGVVHLLFNVLGVLFFVFVIPQFAGLVRAISPSAPELEGIARLAAETPRQVANTHTIFSVANTLVLIWFVTPIARFAQWLVPSRHPLNVNEGEPLYLDDASLAAASLGLEKANLEVVRLGGMVLRTVEAGLAADATPRELANLLEENQNTDRLTSSILLYIGRLSQVAHSESEGKKMIGLTRITSRLDGIRDVMTHNLIPGRLHRMEDGARAPRLGDQHILRLEEAVTLNLEQVIALIRPAGTADEPVALMPQAEIDKLAANARRSVLGKVGLITGKTAVLNFRQATDRIEAVRQIARLTWRMMETLDEQGV
jgi:phosphate:Na+ symporter